MLISTILDDYKAKLPPCLEILLLFMNLDPEIFSMDEEFYKNNIPPYSREKVWSKKQFSMLSITEFVNEIPPPFVLLPIKVKEQFLIRVILD